MTRQFAVAMMIIASLPITVQVPRDSVESDQLDAPEVDRSATRILLATGSGEYDVLEVLSGCDGPSTTYRTKVSHTDAGAQIEQEFGSHGYIVGARGGVLNESQGTLFTNGVPGPPNEASRSVRYGNPYVAREASSVGLGVGAVISSEEFVMPTLRTGPIPWSGHLRFGQRHGFNLQLRYMEAVPLVAGGDYGDVGVGLPLSSRGEAWVGMGFDGPADMQTEAVRAQFHVVPELALRGGGFWGSKSGGDGQDVKVSGWHVGIEWQWSHARIAPTVPAEATAAAAPPARSDSLLPPAPVAVPAAADSVH